MNIIQKPLSVNFEVGRGGRKPLFVVIHCIGLPGVTAESAIQRFTDPKEEVSSHYIIKRDGTILQLVSEEYTAWANGQIGNNIPIANIAAMYYRLGVSLNQISISIENEGSELSDIPDVQYQANGDLVKDICKRWNIPIDRLHIIGHKEIKDTKSCPGRISVDKIVRYASQIQPVQPSVPTPIIIDPVKTDNSEAKISLLQKLLGLYQKLLALLEYKKTLGAVRSNQWPKVREAHLELHPVCELCGGKKKLQVHHKLPFHLHPQLELDPTNLITLCEGIGSVNCHLFFGHLGNFKSYNANVVDDSKEWNTKMANRP